ncbi:Transcription factor SKN7 [Phytophthora citrophthora]|uniref:Transcription factor SKN7 n=1 Tax=Phytophthora citrophthora TaxID=4793 RepID=A0AAD9GTY6_9STRA|nr:Transcription factor SKN7 [Phytophthora citrophthora]
MDTTPTNANNAIFASAPRFVRAVYEILQNEDQRILSWSADGSHFQVYDVPRLETEVLRKYFKHGKFSSFQRQLNNFGFHKWTKTRASVATFSHDVLVRCHLSQLDILAAQMKLKQKAARSTLVNSATSTKRPRSLLSTATEHKVGVKRHKLSPRDVCAVNELSDVSCMSLLDSLWLLEDDSNCGSSDDMLLLDVLDSVELAALDWDAAAASPLEEFAVELGYNNHSSDSDVDINASMYLEADLELNFGDELGSAAVASGLLTEGDVEAVLFALKTEVRSDCDLDALIGGASNEDFDIAVELDILLQ